MYIFYIQTHTYIYIHTYTHTHIYIYMYVCIYIYIYIHTWLQFAYFCIPFHCMFKRCCKVLGLSGWESDSRPARPNSSSTPWQEGFRCKPCCVIWCIWEWLIPWPLQDLAEEFDHELSRWLVDMEGPIRESSRMLEAMAEESWYIIILLLFSHVQWYIMTFMTILICRFPAVFPCPMCFQHEPPGRSAAVAAGSREPQGQVSAKWSQLQRNIPGDGLDTCSWCLIFWRT